MWIQGMLFFNNCIEKNQNKTHFEEGFSSLTNIRDGSFDLAQSSFPQSQTGTMVCEHRIVWPIVERHKVVLSKIPSIYDHFIWQYFDRWSLVLYLQYSPPLLPTEPRAETETLQRISHRQDSNSLSRIEYPNLEMLSLNI